MANNYNTKTSTRVNGKPVDLGDIRPPSNQPLTKNPNDAINAEVIREEMRQKALATPIALLESVYADLTQVTSEQMNYLGQTGRDFVTTKVKTTIEIPVK